MAMNNPAPVQKRKRVLIDKFPSYDEAHKAREKLKSFHSNELQVKKRGVEYHLYQRVPI